MASKSKSIIGGMTVLGIAGIICKLVGVLFSIPLTYVIGAQGQGIYNAVFPTYNLLLTISSAGLPVAVSRMVSSALAKDDPHSAKHVFRVALLLLTTLGCIAAIIMLAGSGMLAARVNQPDSKIGFQVIAPCVAIVCMMSAFRGFIQGQQDMVPTAISQLIEQVGKVFLALPMAYIGGGRGRRTAWHNHRRRDCPAVHDSALLPPPQPLQRNSTACAGAEHIHQANCRTADGDCHPDYNRLVHRAAFAVH